MSNQWYDIDSWQWVDNDDAQWGFGVSVSTRSDLSASITSISKKDIRSLGMTLAGTHDPVDMSAQLYAKQRNIRTLSASMYAWHARDLTAFMGVMQPADLPATIMSVTPRDLPALLRVRPQSLLTASTRGWGALDLGAYLNQIWNSSLPAYISGVDDTNKFLPARIKGYGSEYRDISASIRSFHWRALGASVRAKYFTNLPAYLNPVPPRDLQSSIHAWHERYLQVIINGEKYPWELAASIYPKGVWNQLTANIYSAQGTEHEVNLTARARPWHRKDFLAYIFGDTANFLTASISTLGYSSSLNALIRPKMIRLTTVIDIPTMSHSDLSAIINFPCRKTGYAQLMANLYVKFKGDLSAYIRPIVYDYKPRYLGAKVGYTDAYLEVDKLRLGIIISPDDYMTEDKFKLVFSFLNAELMLSAYIRGTLRYEGISAYINAEQIPKYVYTTAPKNRERVIHKTYAGIFERFEIVEMAFKSAVEDYFYSSPGKYAWKEDRYSKWMLSVKSILPADTALRLRRRLHRTTTLYDLSKFASVDEAMKFAIAYVTEYPQGNLSASIFNRGTYAYLSAVLNPRYVKTERDGLSSTITSVGDTVVVNKKASIIKI